MYTTPTSSVDERQHERGRHHDDAYTRIWRSATGMPFATGSIGMPAAL